MVPKCLFKDQQTLYLGLTLKFSEKNYVQLGDHLYCIVHFSTANHGLCTAYCGDLMQTPLYCILLTSTFDVLLLLNLFLKSIIEIIIKTILKGLQENTF